MTIYKPERGIACRLMLLHSHGKKEQNPAIQVNCLDYHIYSSISFAL